MVCEAIGLFRVAVGKEVMDGVLDEGYRGGVCELCEICFRV